MRYLDALLWQVKFKSVFRICGRCFKTSVKEDKKLAVCSCSEVCVPSLFTSNEEWEWSLWTSDTYTLFLTLGVHVQRGLQYFTWFVCLSDCLCVNTYSRTTGYEVANERHQLLHNYANLKNEKEIFLKRLRSRDMPSKQAKKPICIIELGLLRPDPLALCILKAQEVPTKGVISNPTCCLIVYIASLCQTLCEPLAWRRV